MLLSVIKSTNHVSGLCIAVVCNHFAIENSIRNRTCVGKVDKCKFTSNLSTERVLSVYIKLWYWPLLILFLIKSRVKEYIEKVTRNNRSKGQNPSNTNPSDYLQTSISALIFVSVMIPLSTFASMIFAPGAEGCSSATVLPNPLLPEVANRTIFLPVKS